MFKLKVVRWLVCTGLLAACANTAVDSPEVGLSSQALSPCDETVPATRNIDGIPAYAQCSASQDSAIYSNNGVDTSLTKQASDWVLTQYGGGFQCTELAHRYLYFKWQVKWIPNGDAGKWCDTQPPASSGLVQTMTPVHGDIMVLAPGSCGSDPTTGHVNVVDTVDAARGSLVAVEQNQAGRNKYMQTCGKCFLHVAANDGTPSPAATTAGAAATSAAGSPASAAAAGSAGLAKPPSGPTGRAGAGAAGPTQPTAGAPVATNGGAVAAPPGPARPTTAGAAGLVTPGSTSSPLAAAGSAAPAVTTPADPTAARPRAPAPESACSVASTRWSARPGGLMVWWFGVLGLTIAGRRRR